MRIEYDVTTADLVRSIWMIGPLRRSLGAIYLILFGLLIWIEHGAGVGEEGPGDWVLVILVNVFVLGVSFIVVLGATVVTYVLQVRTVPGLLGRHVLEVRDDGLFEQTSANQTIVRWHAFRPVVRKGSMALLSLSWWLFFPIPRRAFPSPEVFRIFCDELDRRIREGKGAQPDATANPDSAG